MGGYAERADPEAPDPSVVEHMIGSWPGGSIQDSRTALVAAAAALSGLREQLWQAGDGDLGDVFAEVAASPCSANGTTPTSTNTA